MATKSYRLMRAVLMTAVNEDELLRIHGGARRRAHTQSARVARWSAHGLGPGGILPAIREHLVTHVEEEPTALVFTGPNGAPIWRGNFNKLAKVPDSVAKLGVPGLHFHDLRHTGNTFAARTGASTRELMARMGHDSPQAALIYQHATAEADRAIAQAVDDAMRAERRRAKKAAKPKKTGKRRDDPDDGAAGVVARRR